MLYDIILSVSNRDASLKLMSNNAIVCLKNSMLQCTVTPLTSRAPSYSYIDVRML